MNNAVVISSNYLDEKLIETVNSLLDNNIQRIIIIANDTKSETLDKLKRSNVDVFSNNTYSAILKNYSFTDGIVFVDDIYKCSPSDIGRAVTLMNEKRCVVLGVQDFSKENITTGAKVCNSISRFILRFSSGVNISDTQAHLIAIPGNISNELLDLEGRDYTYKVNLLLYLKKHNIGIEEIKLSGVQVSKEKRSFSRFIKDIFVILKVVIKFLLSSCLAALIDVAVFSALTFLLPDSIDASKRLFISVVSGRIIASIANFAINRKAVFRSSANLSNAIIRYYVLWVICLSASYTLLYLITTLLSLTGGLTIVAKICVDLLLFLFSYQVQQRWVFK